LHRWVDGWSAGATSPLICPLPADQLPVPTEQGLGPDHEQGPPVPWHRPARRGEQKPIQTAQAGASQLPLQHLHLVPEHQELDVSFGPRSTPGPQRAANEVVQEREQHGSPSQGGERMLPVREQGEWRS
jgi:hypothetical protein